MRFEDRNTIYPRLNKSIFLMHPKCAVISISTPARRDISIHLGLCNKYHKSNAVKYEHGEMKSKVSAAEMTHEKQKSQDVVINRCVL